MPSNVSTRSKTRNNAGRLPRHSIRAYYNRRKKSQGKLCERKRKTKRKPFSRRKRALIYSDKRHASFLHASSVYFRRVNKPTRSRSTMYGSLSANKIPPPSINRKCHQNVKNGDRKKTLILYSRDKFVLSLTQQIIWHFITLKPFLNVPRMHGLNAYWAIC